MPETPYFKRIFEHSSNYADINKKRSEWDLNPRARKRTTAFRVFYSEHTLAVNHRF